MGVTLSAGDIELCAVVGVEVAAVSCSEHPANVVTRWTAQCRRSIGITLTPVCVIIWTVEVVVVTTATCTGDSRCCG